MSSVEYQRFVRNTDGHPFLGIAAAFFSVPLITDTLFSEPTQALPENTALLRF